MVTRPRFQKDFSNRTSSDRIKPPLGKNEVFVFGSNEAGRHEKGAAATARSDFGAIYGQSEGLQGNSYAIPTVNFYVNAALPIKKIKEYVDRFFIFAEKHPELTFLVTTVGTGLAGHPVRLMAPLFEKAADTINVYLPEVFWTELRRQEITHGIKIDEQEKDRSGKNKVM